MGLPTTALPTVTRNFYNPVLPGGTTTAAPAAWTPMTLPAYTGTVPGMNFIQALPPPGPVIVGYRPVYANGTSPNILTGTDQFMPTTTANNTNNAPAEADSSPPSAADDAFTSDTTTDPAADTTAAAAKPATAQNAAQTQQAAPATYEEEIGDRITKVLQRNPELTTRLKGWEQTLDAKGLDLETLANNPEQMVQELISDPNSIVGQNLDEFRQTKTYRLVYHVYKLVPKPLKKLFIKVLPQKYKSIAEQTLNTLFEQPPSAASSASSSKSKKSKTDSLNDAASPSSALDSLDLDGSAAKGHSDYSSSDSSSSPDLSALLDGKDSEAPAHAALS